MKRVLILSATSGSNLALANRIKEIIITKGAEAEVLSIEELSFPLYSPSSEKCDGVDIISEALCNAGAYIICAPEYNGSIPPVVTNAIAWISVSTDGWRDAFNNKFALIASSSGGPGTKYLLAMRTQLEHLGSIVLPRTIMTSSNNPFNIDSASKIINNLLSHI
tara:strand:- start:913 stop:1404 length:492 start_codon:yes stop_codon:yes gene_type:complete